MAKSEQQPRKGAGKPVPGKKPTNLDKPGIDEQQLGKVAGGLAAAESKRK
ncbi:MAG TPA: hypothetical protein VMT54_00700 [Candidatus Cybelea sp.]|nr:hypothetical protein [Candidatus Cybelea sp.]